MFNQEHNFEQQIVEECSEPCQTSKMELFVKNVNGRKSLPILAKRFILDVFQGCEYISG